MDHRPADSKSPIANDLLRGLEALAQRHDLDLAKRQRIGAVVGARQAGERWVGVPTDHHGIATGWRVEAQRWAVEIDKLRAGRPLVCRDRLRLTIVLAPDYAVRSNKMHKHGIALLWGRVRQPSQRHRHDIARPVWAHR